jgi:polysaccharide biosynthesis PFTS motif protein
MQHNELDFIDDPDMFISATEAIKIFPIYRLILKSSFKKDDLLLYTGLSSLYLYLRWKCFSENIRIENLISHADFGITSITRNIILEEYGCVTYYYMNTINYDFYYDRRGRNDKYRDSRFGFLYYDYLFVWNDTVSKYFKASQCKIKEYLNLGSFWAEHLRLIEEKVWTSDFRNELYDRGYKSGMKLVSVFDSGLSDEYITTYEDGIKFLEGILRLLDDLPDIFVVLKEKKPRDYHKMMSDRFDDILKLYQKLENNARCLCIKNSWKNSSEIMAFTDLVISFPFTSTTAEALAVRKKAIWYDGTDKFRGAIYDNAPGLVCHNYNELLERTKRLLCISEKDYNAYLESYIKGRVENYLDGKAITRFREHLSEKSSNHAGPKKASKGRLHEYTYQR